MSGKLASVTYAEPPRVIAPPAPPRTPTTVTLLEVDNAPEAERVWHRHVAAPVAPCGAVFRVPRTVPIPVSIARIQGRPLCRETGCFPEG